MGLSKKAERDLAKHYFIHDNLTVKEIAERVKVSEKTIVRWSNEDAWKKMKASLLTTKDTQIRLLYDQLANLNEAIATRENKTATTTEADQIIKLTRAIKTLEVETSIGEFVEVSRALLSHVKQFEDMEFVKRLTKHLDAIIMSKAK